MPTVESNGAIIHYEIAGPEGAPWLVFSNSLGSNLTMWDGQIAAFAADYRILRYDSRGHGRSSVPEGPYTIEQLGRDALAVMDAVGIERARYCGLSKGGMVGMWLGVNAPSRLSRLALCNTAAYMPPASLWNDRIETANTKGMAALTETIIERWLTEPFRKAAPEAVARVRQMLLSTPPKGYAACCAAIRDMDQREAISRIDLPTLVIAGAHDPATPPEKSEEIANAVAGARLITLDAAHLSNIEREDAFNEALRAFLKI